MLGLEDNAPQKESDYVDRNCNMSKNFSGNVNPCISFPLKHMKLMMCFFLGGLPPVTNKRVPDIISVAPQWFISNEFDHYQQISTLAMWILQLAILGLQ